MGKSNPQKPLRRGQRPYVDLDPADSLLLRQIAEKLTVAIIKLHNLDVKIQELHTQTSRANTLFLALLNDPQARQDIEAVARDLRIETFKKT